MDEILKQEIEFLRDQCESRLSILETQIRELREEVIDPTTMRAYGKNESSSWREQMPKFVELLIQCKDYLEDNLKKNDEKYNKLYNNITKTLKGE